MTHFMLNLSIEGTVYALPFSFHPKKGSGIRPRLNAEAISICDLNEFNEIKAWQTGEFVNFVEFVNRKCSLAESRRRGLAYQP